MKRKYMPIICAIIGILLIISIIALIINECKRRSAVYKKQGIIAQSVNEINELCTLGFNEHDEAITILKDYIDYTTRACQLPNNDYIHHTRTTKQTYEHIEQLINLNKKMMASYARDIQDFQKLHIPPYAHIVSFARDKLMRLFLALLDLERQRGGMVHAQHVAAEYMLKAQRMRTLNRQSIALYKQALKYEHTMYNIQRIKEQLTHKMRLLYALERFIEP